jgi:hypothetical protein
LFNDAEVTRVDTNIRKTSKCVQALPLSVENHWLINIVRPTGARATDRSGRRSGVTTHRSIEPKRRSQRPRRTDLPWTRNTRTAKAETRQPASPAGVSGQPIHARKRSAQPQPVFARRCSGNRRGTATRAKREVCATSMDVSTLATIVPSAVVLMKRRGTTG